MKKNKVLKTITALSAVGYIGAVALVESLPVTALVTGVVCVSWISLFVYANFGGDDLSQVKKILRTK